MVEKKITKENDVSIVICGEAGQGVDTTSAILLKIFKLSNYNVYSSKEFMSRVRGGTNSTQIRVASSRIKGHLERIDILVSLSNNAINHLKNRITSKTIIIGEKENLDYSYQDICKIIEVPFTQIAKEAGNKLFINTVSVGVLAGLFNVNPEIIEKFIKTTFETKGEEIILKNLTASKKGYETGQNLLNTENISFNINPNPEIKDEIVISGNDAIAYGCIAGGCNFISSYPMSPSTGVFTVLSQQQKEMGIISEQVEDEIAALNMSLGAWYAGARSMVSTSGGGFALMTEAVSLAGMLESPAVIHIAQRPGPATGLPTRTGQEDLNLALYAGHGEFQRIILAPGTPEDAFYLSQQAFNLADQYQIPVFILSDQYLVESSYNIPMINASKLKNQTNIITTNKDYKRYSLTETGISPRGIPGLGEGIVCVDSDEHDEEGHITENLDIRIQMVDKRYKKRLELINKDIIEPELFGNSDYKTLLIGWGSTHNIILEALNLSNNTNLGYLHFKQVYPVHPKAKEYLNKANKVVVIEQNASGQFANLLFQSTGVNINERILKYNGIQFYVEELLSKFNNL